MKNFWEESYKFHSDNIKRCIESDERADHAETWLNNNTVDYWRHERMYKMLDPIIENFPNATWLTVGDGRYGSDAHYILEKGSTVLATDISDVLLQQAANIRYISKYKEENAENLSFDDETFDFVFCKQSFHHFPRPMLALYEMLRVARKGVVLIEPNDRYIASIESNGTCNRIIHRLNFLMKSLPKSEHSYEEVGNYVYKISKREIEKFVCGLGFEVVAFNYINDYYIKGCEYEICDEKNEMFRSIQLKIKKMDTKCKLNLQQYSHIISIIFKIRLKDAFHKDLTLSGYNIVVLPKNPLITQSSGQE